MNIIGSSAHLPVNELYGPVLQGEGPDIGKPSIFLRVHNCPVKCPGCDSHYTWDKSEEGKVLSYQELQSRMAGFLEANPGVQIVLTGGEPLLYYKNRALSSLIASTFLNDWTLETSGYIGNKWLELPNVEARDQVTLFLKRFKRVTLSPKITPCLTSPTASAEELTIPIGYFVSRLLPDELSFKFVVRDIDDMVVVLNTVDRFSLHRRGYVVYLMPYGVEKDEIAKGIETLLPFAAKYGYVVTPRLQSLMYGKARGV